MNNQGLEALAALASAAPSSLTANRGSGESSSNRSNGERGAGGSREASGTAGSVASDNGSSTRDATAPQATQSAQQGDQANQAPQLAQWQQLMSNLAASGGNANVLGSNPGAAGLSLLTGLQQAPQADNSSLLVAMQNMAQYQLMAQAQAASQNQLSAISNLAAQLSRTNQQANGMGLSLQNPFATLFKDTNQIQTASHQSLHGANDGSKTNISQQTSTGNNSTTSVTTKREGPSRPRQAAPIAPQPPPSALDFKAIDSDGGSEGPGGDKREQKRAANRRSAQLSRKRKKQFIEELKEENDDLRRKEQILKSLPDLVVVFDSSGKLGFVSHSVDRLLNFSANELEGSSFWERLCEESVRLLKAAFMDSLATRESGSDTAPLGSGVWELRLVDKDGSQKMVALNGVVHFAGDRPECVCTIRPRDDKSSHDKKSKKPGLAAVSVDGTTERPSAAKKVKVGKSRDLVRISDSGNSTPESADSESGSSDE